MDSGATCHMTPYKIDFIPLLIKPVKKVNEVADGLNVLAEFSGTVIIKTRNDAGDKHHFASN